MYFILWLLHATGFLKKWIYLTQLCFEMCDVFLCGFFARRTFIFNVVLHYKWAWSSEAGVVCFFYFYSGSVISSIRFMEDAKLLSESLAGVFMEAVQCNQPRRTVSDKVHVVDIHHFVYLCICYVQKCTLCNSQRQIFFNYLKQVLFLDVFEDFMHCSVLDKTVFCLGEKQGMIVNDDCYTNLGSKLCADNPRIASNEECKVWINDQSLDCPCCAILGLYPKRWTKHG